MSPSLGQEGPLEEGLETHSSILAWRIPMDRGAQWAKVHGIAQSWTLLKQLSIHLRQVLKLSTISHHRKFSSSLFFVY